MSTKMFKYLFVFVQNSYESAVYKCDWLEEAFSGDSIPCTGHESIVPLLFQIYELKPFSCIDLHKLFLLYSTFFPCWVYTEWAGVLWYSLNSTLFLSVPREKSCADLEFSKSVLFTVFNRMNLIAVGIQAVLNGHMHQAKDNCAASCSVGCIGKQVVLPVNDKEFYTAFDPVIAQLQPAVFQIITQIRPLLFNVVQCLAQCRLRHYL